MDPVSIAAYFGIGLQTISLTLQAYQPFKRSNVDKFFEKIIKSGIDVTQIGQIEDLQRYLFAIIEKVSVEANEVKIDAWKNSVIYLATDFADFDYNDNFLRSLDDFTVFDLTVLYKIYSTEFNKKKFKNEVVQFFNTKMLMSI